MGWVYRDYIGSILHLAKQVQYLRGKNKGLKIPQGSRYNSVWSTKILPHQLHPHVLNEFLVWVARKNIIHFHHFLAPISLSTLAVFMLASS
jgi:hypothetical protein